MKLDRPAPRVVHQLSIVLIDSEARGRCRCGHFRATASVAAKVAKVWEETHMMEVRLYEAGKAVQGRDLPELNPPSESSAEAYKAYLEEVSGQARDGFVLMYEPDSPNTKGGAE